MTYGEAFKLATFAMIPPVLLSLVGDYTGMSLKSSVIAYFALYVLLLVLAVTDLVKTPSPRAHPSSPITP
jgi:hypothetical protein